MKSRRLDKNRDTNIPRHEIEAIAQTLYPDILAFFKSEQGQREFEEWEKQQNAKQE